MRHAQQGLTLIEAMIVLTIIGISVSIAVPSFRDFIADNEMTAHANEFISALVVARSEAIRTQTNVSVIAGADNWSTAGWAVAIDANGDNVADANELVRDYSNVTNPSMTMTNNIALNSRVIVFDKRGIMILPNAGFTMTLCDDRTTETGRQMDVNITGRVSLNPNFACP